MYSNINWHCSYTDIWCLASGVCQKQLQYYYTHHNNKHQINDHHKHSVLSK